MVVGIEGDNFGSQLVVLVEASSGAIQSYLLCQSLPDAIDLNIPIPAVGVHNDFDHSAVQPSICNILDMHLLRSALQNSAQISEDVHPKPLEQAVATQCRELVLVYGD
eukprot:133601-Rhodomonas_salina.2